MRQKTVKDSAVLSSVASVKTSLNPEMNNEYKSSEFPEASGFAAADKDQSGSAVDNQLLEVLSGRWFVCPQWF